MAKPTVCILSDVEVDLYKDKGIAPSCTDHRHMRVRDALDMIDGKFLHQKAAEWVGPRHIRLLTGVRWKVKHSSVLPDGSRLAVSTMQLVPG